MRISLHFRLTRPAPDGAPYGEEIASSKDVEFSGTLSLARDVPARSERRDYHEADDQRYPEAGISREVPF